MKNSKKTLTALVLQGGGALGAYEYGVVKALYEQEEFHPDVVTGVSIGAISAAVIAGPKNGDPVASLDRLWEMLTFREIPFMPQQLQLLLSMPCNPAMYYPNMEMYFNPQHATSFSDTTPLYKTLEELVDFKRIKEKKPLLKNGKEPPRLIVTATNIKTGQI